MKHFGDITKLSGYDLPIVDVITGGSPCQDLSVAGKRAGLDGERSGLFMEQIRIIKEMRDHDRQLHSDRSDEFIRPRFMVWENVPGAFSSNHGADFQTVLTEIVRIVKADAPDVPLPKGGKWAKSGCLMGRGDSGQYFSIAWRLHDAQFWGVAQRRKRIALVADFGGLSAGEICFERAGVRGDSDQVEATRENSAGAAGGSAESAIGFNRERCGAVTMDEAMPTLQAAAGESGNNQPMVCYGISSYDSNAMRSDNPTSGIYEADTARTLDLTCGNPSCNQGGIAVVYSGGFDGSQSAKTGSIAYRDEQAPTLINKPLDVVTVLNGQGAQMEEARNVFGDSVAPTLVSSLATPVGNTQDGFNVVMPGRTFCMDHGFFQTYEDVSGAQLAKQYKDPPVVYQEPAATMWDGSDTAPTLTANNAGGEQRMPDKSNFNAVLTYQEKTGSLMASGYEKNGTQEAANDMYVVNHQVRRLTPTECERLQGFPDGWTDIGDWVDTKGKLHKAADSARYKALGNSIAVGYANNASGFWMWLLKRISAQYERNATLGSLFDGIGGFPLAWEYYNGKGSAVWASEIEEFPIAVTKRHFPEGDEA